MTSNTKLHIVILLSFIFLSIVLTIGRVGTAFDSFALLTPDLGVYASFAAAQDHPELFVNDPFLSKKENVNSYNMLQVPLLKALNGVFGNYGTACAFLLPFFLFIHLASYYLLGFAIFKDHWMGLIVSLLLSAPTATVYDFWGLILDALPRFLYQSLIPLVLVISVRYGKDPKWWPVILGGVGVLNYVHPLSTPSWTIAVILALWISASEMPFWEKVRKMVLPGIVLLLILSPFILNYVRSTIVETGGVSDYDQTISILRSRFVTMGDENFINPFKLFSLGENKHIIDAISYLVWLIGLSGIIFTLMWQPDTEAGFHMRLLVGWMLGIFVVGGFIPVIERSVFEYLKQIPPEFEISRTLRYLAPLILLAAFYTVWLFNKYLDQNGLFRPSIRKGLFIVMSLLLLVSWGAVSQSLRPDFRAVVRQNLSCWLKREFICSLPQSSMDFIDILNVIKEDTPVGARIFSEGQEVAIRYYALRPLVFTYKDGAPLAYTDQRQLLLWNSMYQEMDELAFVRKFPFRHRRFTIGITDVAQRAGADYLLLSEAYDPKLSYPEDLSLVYTNQHYSLFQITREE